MAGAWRREAAWVDARRLERAEAWWPYSGPVEAEEARLAARADPATVAAFQHAIRPPGEPEGLTLDSDG